MSGDRGGRVGREGIHIDRDLADSVALDKELDANVVGPYRFPQPTRRRYSAWVFLGGAVIAVLAIEDGWIPALGLAALAAWNSAGAWPLRLGEESALAAAAAAVDFPVGHASAAVTFHGWRSRPRWSVVLYSADEPPSKRALVVVDGGDGHRVGEPYVEEIPPEG